MKKLLLFVVLVGACSSADGVLDFDGGGGGTGTSAFRAKTAVGLGEEGDASAGYADARETARDSGVQSGVDAKVGGDTRTLTFCESHPEGTSCGTAATCTGAPQPWASPGSGCISTTHVCKSGTCVEHVENCCAEYRCSGNDGSSFVVLGCAFSDPTCHSTGGYQCYDHGGTTPFTPGLHCIGKSLITDSTLEKAANLLCHPAP